MASKQDVRDSVDMSALQWTRYGDEQDAGALVVARVEHDGDTFTLVRSADKPDSHVLVYDEREWQAFTKGARAGEFSEPYGE